MRYSPVRVIWNDWPALASSLAIPITWIIHFGFPYLHRGAVPFPLGFPIGVSVTLTALLLWRINRVGWFFARGVAAVGVITDLLIAKDRGRLEFEFEVRGKRVRSWMPIHKTRAVMRLSPGDRVELLYDENEPARAIVRCLFSGD